MENPLRRLKRFLEVPYSPEDNKQERPAGSRRDPWVYLEEKRAETYRRDDSEENGGENFVEKKEE
ncbi:MAG: hypothetical protein HOE80_04905 [Candidatus Magasanikbacteria bacterium]|jgi:hypothetical protein|nr:hypothetical protein [Candidatus Magasanikbacteria bacterium]MBT4072028.1 hypothetical protein [Candidatus Magasanikbacteria bacterium]